MGLRPRPRERVRSKAPAGKVPRGREARVRALVVRLPEPHAQLLSVGLERERVLTHPGEARAYALPLAPVLVERREVRAARRALADARHGRGGHRRPLAGRSRHPQRPRTTRSLLRRAGARTALVPPARLRGRLRFWRRARATPPREE